MEKTYQLQRPEGNKTRKRVGCGTSSGHGKTSGRGHKGQFSRSGSKHRAWFEGGQMPLQRRIPKRGFNNIFKKEFEIVNITSLEKLNVADINPEVLEARGVIKCGCGLVKILGSGDVTKAMKVTADAFSASAMEKIKKAGGEAIIREVKRQA